MTVSMSHSGLIGRIALNDAGVLVLHKPQKPVLTVPSANFTIVEELKQGGQVSDCFVGPRES